MSETENGRLGLYGTEHSKCNHLMTLGFKGLSLHAAHGCEAHPAYLRPPFGILGDFDQQSSLDYTGFGMRLGFISRSVYARLQVSVCSSYDLFHPV